MRKPWRVLALLVGLLPGAAEAQGFGVGAKAGSVGVGFEAALALGSLVDLRVGGALLPFGFDATLEEIDWSVDLPPSYAHVGFDLYPTGGAFHLMGGLLYKPDDVEIGATPSEPQEIGGRIYNPEELGTLVGAVESSSLAPFLGLGLGRHSGGGVGLFMDLGAAFLGEPSLVLEHRGGTLTGPEREELEQRLETERREVEADLRNGDLPQRLLEIWPILQAGVRLGVGG